MAKAAKAKSTAKKTGKIVEEVREGNQIIGRTSGCRKEDDEEGCQEKEGGTVTMDDTDVRIHFDAPAVLRKWPSLNNERIKRSWGATPYLVADGTLDECIREFMSKPASQHHLYEIHTAPQGDLVSAVLSAEHIVELARLRDFL